MEQKQEKKCPEEGERRGTKLSARLEVWGKALYEEVEDFRYSLFCGIPMVPGKQLKEEQWGRADVSQLRMGCKPE